MKRLLYIPFVLFSCVAFAQTTEEYYPDTLWCPDDVFAIRYDGYPEKDTFKVSRTDRISPGTDAYPNAFFAVYYGRDSMRFHYNNKLPYQHNIYIPFRSPRGQTTLRFHFNWKSCYFPQSYMETQQGKASFEVPEVYELANIIWTLSPSGQRATDLNKEGAYYEKVKSYFSKYLDHPVFRKLDFPDSLYFEKYYGFRENSFAFRFKNAAYGSKDCSLEYAGPYYYVFGDDLADSSVFGELRPLVEDFAAKSGFRRFYQENLSFYQKEIARTRELLPVEKMWKWLETEFPKTKFSSYKTVFSPLIRGSHSTQQYWQARGGGVWFKEAVMFICGANRYDNDSALTIKQKEGLYSGIVFTEIDHNYVNPASNVTGNSSTASFHKGTSG